VVYSADLECLEEEGGSGGRDDEVDGAEGEGEIEMENCSARNDTQEKFILVNRWANYLTYGCAYFCALAEGEERHSIWLNNRTVQRYLIRVYSGVAYLGRCTC